LKLLNKSTTYFFLFSILVMIAGGIFLYSSIRKVIYRQIDNSLITEKTIIQDQIEQTDTIPDFAAAFGHQIEVKLLNLPVMPSQVIKDTLIYDSDSDSYLSYRSIFFSGNTTERKGYTISIYQTLNEKQELLKDISLYMTFLFLSLLTISILLNYLISRKLWQPFYSAVDEAAKFDILSDKPVTLPKTDILEFRELNSVIGQMTSKMRIDYLNLKEYNENAAHEIQTPLAVIRAKMDILMQNKNLRKDSIDLIRSINEATTKLFKLNQGLLLISKIENQYFHDKKEISLKKIIETGLDNYKEIMELKGIRVGIKALVPATIEMNEVLADVLISNLLSNAVRYNIDNGFIRCEIDERYIVISNSGLPFTGDPELLFKRFHKGSDQTHSVGLGLSIVKKIADNYNMEISYSCKQNIHELRLYYNPENNF
jgi:signal transduction histidine kinase